VPSTALAIQQVWLKQQTPAVGFTIKAGKFRQNLFNEGCLNKRRLKKYTTDKRHAGSRV